MFTGIVEEIGLVREAGSRKLTIEASKVLKDTSAGDSVAVNGVCLTISSLTNNCFSVHVMPETLRRSNLGELRYADKVNLERALTMGGRMGGHLMLGHVDDVGRIEAITPEEEASIMEISAPAGLISHMVTKGFIAVDGISLTIVNVNDYSFTVSLVDFTLGHTTLKDKRPHRIVNLEVDIIAKYVERLTERQSNTLTLDFLSEYGFLGGNFR